MSKELERTFICAQGNKTIYYKQLEKTLYVFGSNDGCELYKLVYDGIKARYDYIIVPPSAIHPNARLYEIDATVWLRANGPNCSLFECPWGVGKGMYFYGSLQYLKQFLKVYNKAAFYKHMSCSRTHSAIYNGDLDWENARECIMEFNEHNESVETPFLEDILPSRDGTNCQLFCGINCTFIIASNGSIYQKILDDSLQDRSLGIIYLPERFKSAPPDGSPKPIKIVCGNQHVMVLFDDGSFYGFGNDTQGQIPTYSHPLFKRHGGYKIPVEDIACGDEHTLFLLDDGKVVGFGNNNYLQNYSYIPRVGNRVTEIACGNQHSIALVNNEDVMGWGRNTENQLGNVQQFINGNKLFYYINIYATKLLLDKKKQSSKGGSIKKKNLKYKKKISKKLKY
jgi:hypothetical protein